MMYEGKEVWTQENFSYQDVKIGDYVEQAVVDDAMDCLPAGLHDQPVLPDGRAVFPPGGPGNGEWKATYATFKRVGGEWPNGIWQYCGHCFRGENVGTGQGPRLLLRGSV